ncbi:aldo/keto reductase [candidate division KSB1 bacterium]|nr:aldo/keto reductase [candidate division KSB1 bacterium]
MQKGKNLITRRNFVKQASLAISTASGLPLLSNCTSGTNSPETVSDENKGFNDKDNFGGNHPPRHTNEGGIARRVLGKTGLNVSLLAFGGGSLFMLSDEKDSESMLVRAVEAGINFYDTSWDYGDGQSEVRFGNVLNQYRDQVYVSTKLDTRDSDGAKQQFDGCLSRLKMDYVDVLMMHAISKGDKLSTIENGVYKEMVKFKNEGTAKFIGFSVMLEEDLPVAKSLIDNLDIDVVLGIVNPLSHFGNCELLVRFLKEKNIGLLGMKVIRDLLDKQTTASELINYALDRDHVSSTIISHQDINKLEENISIVTEYSTTTGIPRDWGALEEKYKLYAQTHTPVWALPGYRDGMLV